MPNKGKAQPRHYWDSCVFVSYIEEYQSRFADIDALLGEARRGDIEIVTSVATITEVAFTESERLGRALDSTEEQKIASLWTPPSPVKLVEFHQLVAEGARDLVRLAMVNGWQLKPYDALHLSTARFQQVSRFDTYDRKLPKFADRLGYTIGEPFVGQLTITHPTTP